MNRGILWLSFVNITNADDALEHLLSREYLSRVIDVSIPTPLIKDVTLLSFFENEINAIATISIGGKQGFQQKRVRIEQPYHFDPPLNVEDFKAKLDKRVAKYFNIQDSQLKRLSPKLWKSVRDVFNSKEFSDVPIPSLLQQRRSTSNWKNKALEPYIANITDANLLAAEIFGNKHARDQLLAHRTKNGKSFLESVLDGEETNLKTIEDKIIDYDARVLPGFKAMRSHPVGLCELEDENNKLLILNSNRAKIEKTTGVDLIYFNKLFDSYVLVQYKSMNGEVEDRPCYRPSSDGNLERELKAMNNSLSMMKNESLGPMDYRLNTCPFFFKICIPKIAGPYGHELSKGFYLPIPLFELLLKDDVTNGPRGGKYLNWTSCNRRLNNTEFSDMVTNGWVGTSNRDTATIEKLITDGLNAGKQVITSYEVPKPESEINRLRDPEGRYTTSADPTADWDIPF